MKAQAASMYMEGLSLSAIARRFKVSKEEAVRQWMAKFENAFYEKELSTVKDRSVVLLDETKGEEEREGLRMSRFVWISQEGR